MPTELSNADYYRAKSAECSELAARVKDPIAVKTFRFLAADYLELALRGGTQKAPQRV
jgi:hypothetical protein